MADTVECVDLIGGRRAGTSKPIKGTLATPTMRSAAGAEAFEGPAMNEWQQILVFLDPNGDFARGDLLERAPPFGPLPGRTFCAMTVTLVLVSSKIVVETSPFPE